MKRCPVLARGVIRGGLLCCAAVLAQGWLARADDVLPKPFPASRYANMHSPFAPPTVAAPAPAMATGPVVSWADKLSVMLLMEQNGQYIATLLDKESAQQFKVSLDPAANNRSIVLSSVQWGDRISETRVTIRRGTELGQVSFDPTATTPSASLTSPGMIPRPPLPGQNIFHPPPAPNGAMGAGPATIVRRPEIPAAPITGPRALPNRAPVRPLNSDDDDDDDDDK